MGLRMKEMMVLPMTMEVRLMVKMRLMVILPLFGMNSLTHSPLAAAISLEIGGELDKEETVVTL